jgi:HEPN domain-containing protein
MEAEHKFWLDKAESDLKHAESSLGMHAFDWAQLASQQSAEKALKAVCIFNGIGLLKTHDLSLLAKKLNAPTQITKKAGLLNHFYSSSRYPDATINDEQETTTTKEAIDAAKEILKWCKEKIKT